jgi:hypothetical protein
MKAQSIGKILINFKKGLTHRATTEGIATLEILMAFAVIILCISAVVMVVFGNQSLSIDANTNNEAITKAEKLLEDTRALSRTDFAAIDSSTTIETSGQLVFTKNLEVLNSFGECKKHVKSKISWDNSRPQKIEFETFLSDLAGVVAHGGDCDDTPSSEWDNPVTATSINIGGQGATDIDVRNNFIYLTSDASAVPKEDFFVYEFNPTVMSLTLRGKRNVSGGLNGVDVIDDYAFTIDSEISNHLRVFDISNPSDALYPESVTSTSLPNMTTGIARSIYYYDGFVYIGTQYLACGACSPTSPVNNEFHIYKVSSPYSPSNPNWEASINVNHNINDIVVRGDYAYLATSDNTGEVQIFDISNPSSIAPDDTPLGVFDTPGNEDGQALYLLGNKLYLSRDRTPAARKDFYVLDVHDPTDPEELGYKNLGLNPGTTTVGLVVREPLAFVAVDNPTSGLKILNVSDLSSITDHVVCTTLNFSENSTAIDMDDDFIFSANSSNAEIRVIRDQPSTCPSP